MRGAAGGTCMKRDAGRGSGSLTAHRLRLLPLALTVGAACCNQHPLTSEPVPDWLAALIREYQSQPVANPPLYVARYEYDGQVVYYVPPRCCDIWSDLYDSNGRIICHPDGGLAGNGDGRCPDFFARRTNETIIWRDTRSFP